MLRQIGLLTNKFLSLQETKEIIFMMRNLVSGLSAMTVFPENAIRVLFWMAKGLILRLAHSDEVLERLVYLLSHPNHGLASARGFGLLLASDEVLSKKNGANVRLLAKQKVYNSCIPAIAHKFGDADAAVRQNYLIALSGLLRNMPTDIIMPEIRTLLPLLLQTLDLDDDIVKAATIQSLTIISRESPIAVEGHMSSLISKLLKSSVSPKVNKVGVRYNALRCLRAFPGNVKETILLPYKNSVIRGLLKVLDDPKRHVRKEAVECRAVWSNMDEPQSD